MTARELPPPVRAVVRDVAALGRLVGEVLGRLPRVVGSVEVGDQAVPVIVPLGHGLPDVATLGRWTEPALIGGQWVRVAAVRVALARELAARRDRHLAAALARPAPNGCVWALWYDLDGCAVLCTRPVTGSKSSSGTPPVAGAA